MSTSVSISESFDESRSREGWRLLAACRDEDTDLFFPNGETGEALAQTEVAKSICATCPVRNECLEFAMTTNQPYGIFGGLTESERKSLRRRRSRERREAEVAKAS
jgi:WhiB family redox-sensing transcriptional regulator